MDEFRLTTKQITALHALHRKQRDRRFADRLKAIVWLGSGWSVAQVAEALFIDETTVRNWLEKYRQGGETELLAIHDQGKEPSLTDEQQHELAKHLDENTYLDSNAVRHHIETTYGVQYKPSGVKDLLHRLGFVYKKPKHVPGKVDPIKQAAFIAEYEKLRKKQCKNDPVYFGDGCHPQFNSIPDSSVWLDSSRRGEGVEVELRSQACEHQRCRRY